MSTGTYKKKLKRCIRKKLYNFFYSLNEFDFSRLRPVAYLLIFVGLALALAKLPTPETDNSTSPEAAYVSSLASDIRTAVSDQDSTIASADVIALFIPKSLAIDSDEALQNALFQETLYSFYLTGEELSYLAEGNASLGSSDTALYLYGLNYTYHKNRLPFDRVTELTTVSGNKISADALYHVISTEDIFSLFHYISYRSLGLMDILPKNAERVLLSDYQEVLLTENGEPLTIGTALTLSDSITSVSATTAISVVTIRSGFNLVDLVKSPNKVTACVIALFIALIALMWYIVPRLRRIRLWFRIYRIRSRKRSTHTLYLSRKFSGSRRSRGFRRA